MTTVDKYIYEGLGFPLELKNVEMVQVKNFDLPLETITIPRINIREVSDQAIQVLLAQPAELTGNQIGFIRVYFAISEAELAASLNRKKEDVVKWENSEKSTASMGAETEALLKQHIREALKNDDKKYVISNTESPATLVAQKGLFKPAPHEPEKPSTKDTPDAPKKKPK